MKKPLHVSDNSIGCLKSIHFVFEIGCRFRKCWLFIGACGAIQLISILATFGRNKNKMAYQLHVRSEPHGYLFSACISNCYFWKLHAISLLNEDGPGKMHCRRTKSWLLLHKSMVVLLQQAGCFWLCRRQSHFWFWRWVHRRWKRLCANGSANAE